MADKKLTTEEILARARNQAAGGKPADAEPAPPQPAAEAPAASPAAPKSTADILAAARAQAAAKAASSGEAFFLRRLPPHQNRRPIFWPPHVLRQRRKRLVEQLRLLRPLPSQPLIFSPPLVPRRGRVVRLQLLSQQHQPLRRSQRHLPLPQVLV
ncbi:MAG: hypothetical protein KDA90_03160 [Planctomycetaceae bacterium]|nr:hypothetical protein [Planctomycetaceae bacterium]